MVLHDSSKGPAADILLQSVDGRFTASGHENGGIYVFNNDTGRLSHSLPGGIDCYLMPPFLLMAA